MNDFIYICRCEHGDGRIVTIDDAKCKRSNAKTIAKAIRNGLTVERIPMPTVEKLNAMFGKCEICNAKRKAKKGTQ